MNILPDIPRGYDEEILLLYSIILAISLHVLSKKCEIGKTGRDEEPYVLIMILIVTVILWIKQLTNIYNMFNEDGLDEKKRITKILTILGSSLIYSYFFYEMFMKCQHWMAIILGVVCPMILYGVFGSGFGFLIQVYNDMKAFIVSEWAKISAFEMSNIGIDSPDINKVSEIDNKINNLSKGKLIDELKFRRREVKASGEIIKDLQGKMYEVQEQCELDKEKIKGERETRINLKNLDRVFEDGKKTIREKIVKERKYLETADENENRRARMAGESPRNLREDPERQKHINNINRLKKELVIYEKETMKDVQDFSLDVKDCEQKYNDLEDEKRNLKEVEYERCNTKMNNTIELLEKECNSKVNIALSRNLKKR